MADLTSLTRDAFAALGGEEADPPIVLPASLPLELSGEAVRARLCVFTDAGGEEYALRPDLTLSVAQQEAAARTAGATEERIVRYAARAFRLPADAGSPIEFTQVGFERFGAPASSEVDADTFAAVLGAVEAAGAPIGRIRFGDLAVFPSFVEALGLGSDGIDALKRAFRQQGGVGALLGGPPPTTSGNRLSALIGQAEPGEAEAMLGDLLRLGGIQLVGARALAEIAERLQAQARDETAGQVPEHEARTLRRVLEVETEIERAADALRAIAREEGLGGLEGVLGTLATRFEAIAARLGERAKGAVFATTFGRRFNYYDGFVFEVFAPGAPETRPFAAGGRYDGLIGQLSGGSVDVPAIGGVVRPDRLAAAKGHKA